jgi:hypothetical protein
MRCIPVLARAFDDTDVDFPILRVAKLISSIVQNLKRGKKIYVGEFLANNGTF